MSYMMCYLNYSKCKIVPLCATCETHDVIECDFFASSIINNNFLVDHFCTIFVIRCVLSVTNSGKIYRFINKI